MLSREALLRLSLVAATVLLATLLARGYVHLATVFAVFCAALLTGLAQVEVLVRRAAWDFIVMHEQSAEWQEAENRAKRLLTGKPHAEDWASFATRWNERDPTAEQQAAHIFHWANRREFAAVAILERTMHRRIYARCWGRQHVRDWNLVAGFVKALLKTPRGDGELFDAFEQLANDRDFLKLAKWPRHKHVTQLCELRRCKRRAVPRPQRS